MSNRWRWLTTGLIVALWSVACIGAATPGAAAGAGASAGPASTTELPRLASSGQFDQVLTRLQRDKAMAGDAHVAALISDISREQQHERERTARRHEAYEKAIEKMNKALDANKVDEALLAGVDAHGLADDSAATLKQPAFVKVVDLSLKAAADAAAKSDWLEVLNLYRMLDLFYEDAPRYREPIKDSERHVRLLRMYAPDELKRQFSDRVRRMRSDTTTTTAPAALAPPGGAPAPRLTVLGHPDTQPTGLAAGAETQPRDPDTITLGGEGWEKMVEGIDVTLLRTTLARVITRHISSPTYNTVLLGCIRALDILADTPTLSATFPSMNDPAKLAAFKEGVAARRRDVEARTDNLSYLECIREVDGLLRLNRETLDLPESVMVYEMGDGAMSTLDEFSNIFWPHDREEMTRNTTGKFGGVGIQISSKYDPKLKLQRLVVVSPLANTPARRAGIRPGDVIVSVDGQSTKGWTLDQAVHTITGLENTAVTLGIERASGTTVSFKLNREDIPIESIRGWEHTAGGGWNYMIDPTERIGYVRLSQFLPNSATDLDKAINDMDQSGGINALILDLRFDPGGLLSSAVEVANRFVSQGVLVSTIDRAKTVTDQFRARKDKAYPTFPVVVLINEGSASASEIVSGALQVLAHDHIMIIGTRSFGKGSVQDVLEFENEKGFLKLTTHYYCLPNGRILHRQPDSKTWGVEPDLNIKMTAQEMADNIEYRTDVDVLHDATEPPATQPAATADQILTRGLDPQLEEALLVLKTRLVAQHIAVAQKGSGARVQ